MYSALFLKIIDQDKHIVPFVWNNAQNIIYSYVIWARRHGLPLEFDILKARQMGITTWMLGLGFHQTATTHGHNSLFLAHDSEATETIFGKSSLFYDYLPSVIKPYRKTSNKKELVFNNLHSTFRTRTAGSQEGSGVGVTLNFVHATEVGLWRDGNKLISAIRECLPSGSSFFSKESTAYAPVGYFYDEWMKCRGNIDVLKKWISNGKRGHIPVEKAVIPIFLPWFVHKERYFEPLLPGEVLEYSEEEDWLVRQHGLTPEQIKFRRKKMLESDEFFKWYPENDLHCWFKTESTVLTNLNKDLHFIEPFDIRDGDRFYIVGGIDFGSDHPFGYVQVAINKETYEVYVFNEYQNRDVTTDEQVMAIKKGKKNNTYPSLFIADPANRQARRDFLASGIKTYKGINDRAQGIRLVNSLLKPNPETGRPMLHIFNTCIQTWSQMCKYHYKLLSNGLFGDIIKQDDDLLDPLRYILYTLWVYWRNKGRRTPWDYGVMEEESPKASSTITEDVNGE